MAVMNQNQLRDDTEPRSVDQQQSETMKSSNVFLWIAVALMAFQLGMVVGMWVQRRWFTGDSISWPNVSDQIREE